MARTNINLDDRLIREGMKRFKCRTKRELVHIALRELLSHRRQQDILALAGKVSWKGNLSAWREDSH